MLRHHMEVTQSTGAAYDRPSGILWAEPTNHPLLALILAYATGPTRCRTSSCDIMRLQPFAPHIDTAY